MSSISYLKRTVPPKPNSMRDISVQETNISSLDTDPESFIEGQDEEKSMRARFDEIRRGMRDLEDQLGSSI